MIRYAGWVSLIGTALAFIGAYYSAQLYKNLRTNFEELLPTTARSVLDLNEVTRRLPSIDNLAVLIFSKDASASKRFVIDLNRKLQELPKNTISSVEYEISKEIQFFKKRQALYMDLKDLSEVRDFIAERVEYEKELYNPLNIFRSDELPEPKLDFLALRQKYQGKSGSYERFPEGYYATPDGTKRAVLVYIPGGLGVDGASRLKDSVEKIIGDLKPSSYAPDLEIKYTGGVQDSLEEHHALIEDLELSTIIVMALVTVGMLLFYRSIRTTLALVVSLLMGTFWTFGASYFAVGYLNANSAFLGSIVIGNGINFGIIYLARYLEERRNAKSNADAIEIACTQTATATWTAALAAGLSYGSLILTGFRGFKQFGIIGLIGMVLCWISAFTLLPAYITVLDRIKPIVPPNSPSTRKKTKDPLLSSALACLVNRFPGPIWWFSVGLTILSIATLTRFDKSIIETNLSKLRNRHSIEHGSAYLSRYLDEIFQRYMSPLVIMPHRREEALQIAAHLRDLKKKQGSQSQIASVQTLDDFVPKDQDEKIEILKDIQRILPKRILYRLSDKDRRQVEILLTPEVFRKVSEKDLPALVLSKFTEKDGSIGKLVLVEPPLGNDTWHGDKLIAFVHEIRAAADAIAPDKPPVAGTLTISSDMIEAIYQDGPKATLFAFLAVIILVVLLFRNMGTIAQVLFALILGVLWLTGIILGLNFKINFLNFIALPITFGIGVDYGVNIFQRYKQEGGHNILEVIKHAGGAVVLCSFTTITGYTSLLIASNQGFVSFGTLAVAGELTCVIAAVISLPAYLLTRHRKKITSS
jgi:predicted RND superfamily exporter protein